MVVRQFSKRRLFLFLGDLAIILFSFNLALWIRTSTTLLEFQSFQKIALVVFLIVAYTTSFYIFEFYNFRTKFRKSDFLASMGGAFGLTYLLAIFSFYVLPYKLGRGVFLISWVITALLVYAFRVFYSTAFKLTEPRKNVLVLGDGATTAAIIHGLKTDPDFRLAAILDKEALRDKLGKETTGGDKGTIKEFVEQNAINDIVVSFDTNNSTELERVLVNCRMKGIGCHTIEAFYERLFEKLPVLILNDRWFLMSGGFDKLGSRFYMALKRTTDLVIASLILLLTLPVSLLIVLLIPLTSRGPVFFTQERLGAGRKPFKIIKFRTMVDNAEAEGPRWAQINDARVTRLGKFLRRTRLDEIPQFINVLLGELSLIGPRPERDFFVNQLTEKIPFYSLRFFVKPGITGWAQINYRYGANEADALEKLRYELYYIKNQAFLLDLKILLKTIRVMLTGAGT